MKALILAPLFLALPLAAQRIGDVPPRPALAAALDTNSAQAYYLHGVQALETSPREAAAAFYWATRLQPDWAEALYARRVALLMSDPRRLVRYMNGERSTLRSAEVQAIDSLHLRALMAEPFMVPGLDRQLFKAYLRSAFEEVYDAAAAGQFANQWIARASPYMRGWFAYSEGRFGDAVPEYERALRRAEREEKPRVRTDLARVQFFMGEHAAALAHLDTALTEFRARDRRDLVFVYESKALLEFSAGAVHQERGNVDAAREAYGRALQEDLAFAPAHRRMSDLALEAGDQATALSEMALVVELNPRSAASRYRYALMLVQAGQLPEAATQLGQAIESEPYFADPYFVLGLLQNQTGAPQDAQRNLTTFLARAAQQHPNRTLATQALEQSRAAQSGTME